MTGTETSPEAASTTRAFSRSVVLAALATALFGLWIALKVGGSRTTDAFDDIGELVAAWCATGACAAAAARAHSGRRCWALLAASSFAWGVGELVWCYYDLIRGIQVPFPSWADAGFLASVPLACAGLLLFPSSPRRTSHRVMGLLDGAIIATSLLFASWATVLGPLYRSHQGGAFKQSISLAYPMSDVVMLSLVVILIARSGGRHRISLGLVLGGVAAFAIADSSFAYFTEVNSYGNGNVLDTGWVAGYLLIALGALWVMTSPAPVQDPGDESTISIVAPYAPVLVVLAVTSVQLLRGKQIEPVSWTMAFALALLVVGREALRMWDRVTRVGGRGRRSVDADLLTEGTRESRGPAVSLTGKSP
jgi:hypothetical protein